VILFILPDQTEKLFAWKIQPAMSAMMLDAAYAGGIYFFTGVLLSKQWQRVKVGFLALIPFVSMLGIYNHPALDRFHSRANLVYSMTRPVFFHPFHCIDRLAAQSISRYGSTRKPG
jgi:hypothetical protein